MGAAADARLLARETVQPWSRLKPDSLRAGGLSTQFKEGVRTSDMLWTQNMVRVMSQVYGSRSTNASQGGHAIDEVEDAVEALMSVWIAGGGRQAQVSMQGVHLVSGRRDSAVQVVGPGLPGDDAELLPEELAATRLAPTHHPTEFPGSEGRLVSIQSPVTPPSNLQAC